MERFQERMSDDVYPDDVDWVQTAKDLQVALTAEEAKVKKLARLVEDISFYVLTEDGDPILAIFDAQYDDREEHEYTHPTGFRFYLNHVIPYELGERIYDATDEFL